MNMEKSQNSTAKHLTPVTFCSDLHVDYNNSADSFVKAYENYNGYLIVAGDFAEVANDDSVFFSAFEELFEKNSEIYVIFICGNHEYYGSTIENTHSLIANWVEEKDMDRFFFLHEGMELFYAESTLFIGSTLWYPDHPDVYLLQNNINDFSQIQDFYQSVPIGQNARIKERIKSIGSIKEDQIWVFHHLPSYQSVSPNYRGDRLNCYYVDPEMEKLILEQQPRLVIHGHTHHPCMYQIGKTWVVCNPKGYGKQNAQAFNYFKHLFWI